MWKEIIAGKEPPKDLFAKIPYLLADDRKSVEAYLGFRHVTGIEQWRPSEKAEFIARMVDRGMSYETVRKRIGAYTDTVRRNYISYRLMLQIEKTGSVPEENFEDRFSVMYLSLRTSGVQKYLPININAPPKRAQEPVPPEHIKALKILQCGFSVMKRVGHYLLIHKVNTFGHALESKEAVKCLED